MIYKEMKKINTPHIIKKEPARTKIFHITDLPKKELYLIINYKFRNIFFRRLRKHIGGTTILGKILRVNKETARRWKVGKRAFPNWALLKLNNLLKDKKFSIEELEKNIVAYKGESSKRLILKPKLPIIEDERLVRIVSHLLCDGYDGGKTHCPAYMNTETILIQKFIEELSVFGRVPINIREDRKNPKATKIKYTIEFPRIFTHILRKVYNIKDFNTHKSRLPKSFFKLPKKLAFSVIQAFIDDDGNVWGNGFRIGLANFNLIKDFRKFLIKHFPECKEEISDIKTAHNKGSYSGGPQFILDMRRRFVELHYKNATLFHPRKYKLMELIVKRRAILGNKNPEGETRKIILNMLSEIPSNATDLAMKVCVSPKTIRWHLENLKKQERVRLLHKGEFNANIWGIKNEP